MKMEQLLSEQTLADILNKLVGFAHIISFMHLFLKLHEI